MKKLLLQLMLALIVGVTGLCFSPNSAAATFNQPLPVQNVAPAPVVAQDFSDADFATADQPELGTLSGGDVGGLLIFILLVVLLVLLILWLLRQDHVVVR